MSAIVKEVYDAFRSAGVSDAEATAAAQAIPLTGDLATKGDIGILRANIDGVRAELNEVRGELKHDIKELELRMTIKFYAAVGLVVAGIKALDFLIG